MFSRDRPAGQLLQVRADPVRFRAVMAHDDARLGGADVDPALVLIAAAGAGHGQLRVRQALLPARNIPGLPAPANQPEGQVYFTGCCTGRICSPAGPEATRGFRATQAIAMTTAVTTAGTTGA